MWVYLQTLLALLESPSKTEPGDEFRARETVMMLFVLRLQSEHDLGLWAG